MLILIPACAKDHVVNIDEIERNKSKTFNIGIVKAAGRRWSFYGDNLNKKEEALKRIPVKDICNLLAKNYGLKINTQADLTTKIVKEDEGQSYAPPSSYGSSSGTSYYIQLKVMKSDNPYFGNKEYSETGMLKGLFVNPSLKGEDVGNTVDIVYSYFVDGFPLKDKYYYQVSVKSDDKVLIYHYGAVAVHSYDDADVAYSRLVSYADKIPEALARDLRKNSP